jgi:hypothetical protein
MKHRVAKTAVLWSVLTSVVLVVALLLLWFVSNLYSGVEGPLGYARLWLSPGQDVTRHVNFVLSEDEGRGRQISDKMRLLEILELDARWGSRLRYDRTVLIKYAGDDMAHMMDHLNYEEPMQRIAATAIMAGRDADLVRSAFDHYRSDTQSTHGLCHGYAILKDEGAFYNPVAAAYCRDTPPLETVRTFCSNRGLVLHTCAPGAMGKA